MREPCLCVQRYVCTVEKEGDGVVYVLEDGSRHKSPSSAGMKVMGGNAVNGWRFWSLEGDEKQAAAEKPEKAPKEAKPKKAKKLIYRSPNQQGVAQGKSRWFCAACMKGFLHDSDGEPEVCPEGHRIDEPELTGTTEGASE